MRVNITLEDVSPLITYFNPPGNGSTWGNSSVADGCLTSYSQSSFQGTNIDGATATFSFNGTGLWLFGAKGPNHGNYSVTLDHRNATEYSGFGYQGSGCDAREYRLPLFGQSDLSMGWHTIVLTNKAIDSEANWLDLDFVTFETEIGGASASITSSNVDDVNTEFTYSPSGSFWTTSRQQQSEYFDSTVHEAVASLADVTIEFEGEAISLFGAVDTTYGTFTATLDSQTPAELTAASYAFYPRTLLYHANSLGPGTHQLTLINGPSLFDIDYVTMWSANSSASSDPTSSVPTTGTSTSSEIIVGVVLGVMALIAVLLAALILWSRRRLKARRAREMEERRKSIMPPDPIPFMETGRHSHRTPSHQHVPSYAGSTTSTSSKIYDEKRTDSLYCSIIQGSVDSIKSTGTSSEYGKASALSLHEARRAASLLSPTSAGRFRISENSASVPFAKADSPAAFTSRVNPVFRFNVHIENRDRDPVHLTGFYGGKAEEMLPPNYVQATEMTRQDPLADDRKELRNSCCT